MNAKELRIGFYYMHDGSVFEMDSTTLSSILIVGGEYEYDPIPLTEDWLVRFGFKKSKCYLGMREGMTREILFIYPTKSGMYVSLWFPKAYTESDEDHYLKEINYVHQLQNLYYALTGQELDTI